jgi:hypothetical protein
MSNIAGGDSEKSLLLTFFIITAVFYAGAYFSLNHFGYTFADVPSNGNVITPVISAIFTAFSDFITWITTFSLGIFGWSITPFGIFSGIASGLTGLISQFITFINVWNILNIYIFYIIFIPYALITALIVIELVIRLIEGLIP